MRTPREWRWRLRRLLAMPPQEMVCRLWRRLRAGAVRRRIMQETLPAPLADIVGGADTTLARLPGQGLTRPLSAAYTAEIMAMGDEVCAHRVRLFGRTVALGETIDWYRDYLHDAGFARVAANEIEYRRPAGGADIMPVWWLNRHQQLMPAAMAYYVTGNDSYAQEVLRQLESWLTACEYPLGPAWLTGIEAGVRLVTWAWLYRFLFARGRPAVCQDTLLLAWFRSIRQHVRFINTHWAKYSSANNHVIAEAVGVLMAAATWPVLFRGEGHTRRALRILKREVGRQISRDGVDLEQSTSYHAFVLELLVNAASVSEEAREVLREKLVAMAKFLEAVSCDTEEPPDIGDNDWAVASGILARGPGYYRQVIAAARGVCGEPEREGFAAITTPVFWYTGVNEVAERVPAPRAFAGGGYVVWNGIAEDDLAVKVCMDVGPLGLGSLAAHGHADALGLTVHVNGEPVIIDPGTYAYHGEPEWREYFRGTRAHTTLRVDGRDQARQDGPFLWGRHYRVELLHAVTSEDQFDVAARHNGYTWQCGAWHERGVAWHPLQRVWVINDCMRGLAGDVAVELLFHVHPRRVVEHVAANQFEVRGTNYCVKMTMPERLTWRVAVGEIDPPLGWYSPVLGEKEPCPVLVGAGGLRDSEALVTVLEFRAERQG